MAHGESKEVIVAAVREASRIVSDMAGIQLGEKQSFMVESRLKTRMSRLNIASFKDYVQFLRRNPEAESQALLSLLTTHHTYFFREFPHFEFLLNNSLHPIIEAARAREDQTVRIWSAACSRGQEVYSLAMFFRFHLAAMAPDLKFEIWGTDVDPESVAHAKNGVYRAEELKQSPAMYIESNWTRGTGSVRDYSKVKDHIKSHCKFDTLNLLHARAGLSGKSFDLIFCRNVFIYFNQDQIQSISKVLMEHLLPHGFLVLGVSESLHGMKIDVNSVGPSIYRHKGAVEKTRARTPAHPAKKKILDVLSVDDSPAIHTLLSRILTPDQGFKICATAKNGVEAIEILKTQKFDVITLDLHMPELDGIGFLKSKASGEIPVVVVSSVNRDDLSIAQQAIQLGAKDYVEKPSLQNIGQAGNEIRSKLKLAFGARQSNGELTTQSGPTAATSVSKTRVLIVDDSKTIRTLLKQVIEQDPQMEVVGAAEKPSEVEDLIRKTKPTVITLDIHMPEMDGVTLLKKIYPKYRIPCVMISSISPEEGPAVLEALSCGAVDYIQKPGGGKLGETGAHIRERLLAAAQANIQKSVGVTRARTTAVLDVKSLIVMGASTGGTEALKHVLEGLPKQIPPILIVQHIPAIFSDAFAKRLNALLPFEVREARDGDEVKANQVLIAPGGKQMSVKTMGEKLVVRVTDDSPVNRHKPSVDHLFKSVREARIKNTVGVILTGMGADGARELLQLRKEGAKTIAQDEATSVVYGMPREAVKIGAAELTLPLPKIAGAIVEFCASNRKQKAS